MHKVINPTLIFKEVNLLPLKPTTTCIPVRKTGATVSIVSHPTLFIHYNFHEAARLNQHLTYLPARHGHRSWWLSSYFIATPQCPSPTTNVQYRSLWSKLIGSFGPQGSVPLNQNLKMFLPRFIYTISWSHDIWAKYHFLHWQFGTKPKSVAGCPHPSCF